MNIGDAASETGITAKAIRYYETIGLIPAAERTESGYRKFSDKAVQTLHFVRRARNLGFTVAQIGELLSLYGDTNRASADVRSIALARVAEIDRKMVELASMRSTLAHLADKCHGDDRPDCPILEDLARGDE
jgi:MerR family copper efflux transcriptional regulator